MRDELILTFDLGTTRLKVAAFDFHGTLIGQCARRNEDLVDGDSRWQSADRWWRDACEATRELLTANDIHTNQIKGVSLSGRAGAGVFVDGAGEVVADPWSDTRHGSALAKLTAGKPVTSANYGPTLIAKLLWLREHEPDGFARVRHALYGKDFLLFRLTGETVTDPSSGPDGQWQAEMTASIDGTLLPRVAMPWTIAGTVTARAADELGIAADTPVAVGAHDGICANAGAAALSPGRFALTLGTHAVMRTIVDKYPEEARRFYGYPPAHHVIGGNALYAGRALDWFVDQLPTDSATARDETFSELGTAALNVPPGAYGVRFLPFLSGRIAPRRRPAVRASFSGLSLDTNRASQFRALLEGTSFALREVYDQLIDWTGEPGYIGVTGSGARSRLWVQILASVLEKPLTITDGASEGRGAAIFCAAALGAYPSSRDAAANMVHPTAVIEPVPEWSSAYKGIMTHWQRIAETMASLDESA